MKINESTSDEDFVNIPQNPWDAESSNFSMQLHAAAAKNGLGPIFSEYYDHSVQGRTYSQQVGFDAKPQSFFLRIMCYFAPIRALFRWLLHSSVEKNRENILLEKKIEVLSGEDFLKAIKTWNGKQESLAKATTAIQEQFCVFSQKEISLFLQAAIDGKKLDYAILEDIRRIAQKYLLLPGTYKSYMEQIEDKINIYNFEQAFNSLYFAYLRQENIVVNRGKDTPLANMIYEDVITYNNGLSREEDRINEDPPQNKSVDVNCSLEDSIDVNGEKIHLASPITAEAIKELPRGINTTTFQIHYLGKENVENFTGPISEEEPERFIIELAQKLQRLQIFEDIETNEKTRLAAQLLHSLFGQLYLPQIFLHTAGAMVGHTGFIEPVTEESLNCPAGHKTFVIHEISKEELQINISIKTKVIKISSGDALASATFNWRFNIDTTKEGNPLSGPKEYNSENIRILFDWTEEGKAFLRERLENSPTGYWNTDPLII